MDTLDAHETCYPPIGSLGAVGDGRSLALLAPDGALQWFCPGRFDAPPLIWPLLDHARGGRLHIHPSLPLDCQADYLPETAVLGFDWHGPGVRARLEVGMEWPGAAGRQCLLWRVEVRQGECAFEVHFDPQPDFGRAALQARDVPGGLQLTAGEQALTFTAPCTLSRDAQGWHGRFHLRAGETAEFCLSHGAADDGPALPVAERLARTVAAWQNWSARLRWEGRYRAAVVRSAIALKLLIHAKTGAVVAAGTTSLPEAIGNVRNWDYRYTWFRDAGLTLGALFALGCHAEANRWAGWMQRTVERHGMPLGVFYTLDGAPPPAEQSLDVAGYRDSRPVRVGNAAAHQHQLDIYGELLDCVHICDAMRAPALHAHWPHLCETADFIAAHWREPDQGIWEVRSAPRQFVHSKVMAWTGLQRALWLQGRHGLKGDTARWEAEARALREDVLRCGVSADGRHFIRAYDDPEMDASLLLIGRTGFVDPTSALFRNTVAEVRRQLGEGGRDWAIRRYRPDTDDGLPQGEGAFTLCGFWLVEALDLAGQAREAHAIFRQMLCLQGRFGLLGEETDPQTGGQLGNIPQAFSHVGLINAALRLHSRRPTTDELARHAPPPGA